MSGCCIPCIEDSKKAGIRGPDPFELASTSPSAVTGRLLTPSWLTTAGGGLEGNSTGGLSRALFVEPRKRKFRNAALFESLDFCGRTCCPSCCCDCKVAACNSVLAILSTVSLLERSTEVWIVGFLGLRLNLGILSMASGLGKDRCEYPKEKLRLRLVLVAVFTRGLNNSDSPSIRSKGDGDLGVRRGIASGPLGWWRSGRGRIRVVLGGAQAQSMAESFNSGGIVRRGEDYKGYMSRSGRRRRIEKFELM